jgi:hypothetical protein
MPNAENRILTSNAIGNHEDIIIIKTLCKRHVADAMNAPRVGKRSEIDLDSS